LCIMNAGPASSFGRKKRKKLGGPQLSYPTPDSPKPNYSKDVDEFVELATIKTVTVEGIRQMEQELLADAVNELRRQSSLQEGKPFFIPAQGAL